MKYLLAYVLASTGACVVLDSVALNSLVEKINQGLEEEGYEPLSAYIDPNAPKPSISERINGFVKNRRAYTIPIIRFLVPYIFFKHGDEIAKGEIEKGKDKNYWLKKDPTLTPEERLAAIQKKKEELKALKNDIATNQTYYYSFDDEDYQRDNFVSDESHKTL